MAFGSLTYFAYSFLTSFHNRRPCDSCDDAGSTDKEVSVEPFIEDEPAEISSYERLEEKE